ncbi:ankyrin repeat domain-containing protein [Archangium sp.]|jgi:hypothetical protein|uniref:ankyrin repeat domain-containing protein n=1 Tax=Archangium sp. TaxID=1872627 RepID=UPI002ED7C82C
MKRIFAILPVILLAVAASASAQSRPQAQVFNEFQVAIDTRDTAWAERLLGEGLDPNWQDPLTGWTPLHVAAINGQGTVVRRLLERGADPRLKNKVGRTPMEMARDAGHTDIAKLLSGSVGPGAVAPPRPAQPNPPLPPNRLATPQQPTSAPATAGATRWPAFKTYKVGDEVQFLEPTGWKPGVIKEVGPEGDSSSKDIPLGVRKYLISGTRWQGDEDWYDWGLVSGRSREPFWTRFFVGDWELGEVMAMNTTVSGGTETTEYAYAAADEKLRVNAAGTYQWRTRDRKVIQGRWVPAPGGPGIVLKAGHRGLDWTFHNQTSATDENVRGLETARLNADGQLGIRAKRPLRR